MRAHRQRVKQISSRRRPLRAVCAVALLVAVGASADPAIASFPGRNGKLVVQLFRYSEDNLYLINPDGSHPVQVSHGVGTDLEASFSADGTKIVFRRYLERGGGLYVVNADGTGQRPIPNAGGYSARPAFAPDGRTIAFDYGAAGIFTIGLNGRHG
jgi:TolB protein